jgi:hypothetical protein
LFCANRCYPENEDCHRYIHFINNSEKDYGFSIFDEIGAYNPGSAPEMFKLKNNKKYKLSDNTQLDCFEFSAEEGKGKFYFFLFDAQVVETHLGKLFVKILYI